MFELNKEQKLVPYLKFNLFEIDGYLDVIVEPVYDARRRKFEPYCLVFVQNHVVFHPPAEIPCHCGDERTIEQIHANIVEKKGSPFLIFHQRSHNNLSGMRTISFKIFSHFHRNAHLDLGLGGLLLSCNPQ